MGVKPNDKKGAQETFSYVQIPLGSAEIQINASEDQSSSKTQTLSIPSESFNLENGYDMKTNSLLLKVYQGKSNLRSDTIEKNNNKNEDNENSAPIKKRRKVSKDSGTDIKIFQTDLVVYDKNANCLLSDGEYELILREIPPEDTKLEEKSKIVTKEKSVLKFFLQWTKDPIIDTNFNSVMITKNENIHSIPSKKKSQKIVYQFLYDNNSRHQTETREDLYCPWCTLNCKQLFSLLKHLKFSHPRFLFTYVSIPNGIRIDVSIKEAYNSTCAGNPKTANTTQILVCRQKGSMPDFLDIKENNLNDSYDDDNVTKAPFGNEDEIDPPWLRTKICRMIDEFSDVNEGEKEFMKMWNLHVQHFVFVGNCQMSMALEMFIEEKGNEIFEKNLFRNFVLHVCNLFEFGVINPDQAFSTIKQIKEFFASNAISRI